MRVVWRKLTKQDTDWELLLGVLWAPLFALTSLGLMLLPERFVPVCRFRALTGVPCITCGSFRCAKLMLAGRLLEAWRMQPLASVAALAIALFSVYAWVVVLGRRPRLRLEGLSKGARRVALGIVIGVVLANWLYLIAAGR